MQSRQSRASRCSKKKKRLDQLDFLNETDFAMGYDIVEEEGSVELDQSELFLDDDEE
jgi:hypothetical protein